MDYLEQLTEEGIILARQKYQEAVGLAPEYASAYAGIAWAHHLEAWLGWSESPQQSIALAMQHAQK